VKALTVEKVLSVGDELNLQGGVGHTVNQVLAIYQVPRYFLCRYVTVGVYLVQGFLKGCDLGFKLTQTSLPHDRLAHGNCLFAIRELVHRMLEVRNVDDLLRPQEPEHLLLERWAVNQGPDLGQIGHFIFLIRVHTQESVCVLVVDEASETLYELLDDFVDSEEEVGGVLD
jgi:hypothetical protein